MTFTVSEDQMTAVLEADGTARRLKAVLFPIACGRLHVLSRCSLCALRGRPFPCLLPDGTPKFCGESRKDRLPHHWEETA